MALFLVRGGKVGEHEDHFITKGRICLTWEGIEGSLGSLAHEDSDEAVYWQPIRDFIRKEYTDISEQKASIWAGEWWGFLCRMHVGDIVALPRKGLSVVSFGEVTGSYTFEAGEQSPYQHVRAVKWLKKDFPRAELDSDIRFSFGSSLTICRVSRNDAENRVKALLKLPGSSVPKTTTVPPEEETEHLDLDQLARDQIRLLIEQKFKGHKLAEIVEGILKAQGHHTYRSPPGPDGGIDILATNGNMTASSHRLCVQVKSSSAPTDKPVLDQLLVVMSKLQAEQGLLVSWGGFKDSFRTAKREHFFQVRLWDGEDLIENLCAVYDKLPESIQAQLPFKRIWILADQEALGIQP